MDPNFHQIYTDNFFVLKVPYEGPLFLVLILTLMQGLVGMALGLLISAVCDEEIAAIQASLGSVYPNMLLSGKNLKLLVRLCLMAFKETSRRKNSTH